MIVDVFLATPFISMSP